LGRHFPEQRAGRKMRIIPPSSREITTHSGTKNISDRIIITCQCPETLYSVLFVPPHIRSRNSGQPG
jgi:hypothetical protein